jgi:hypothetical protein
MRFQSSSEKRYTVEVRWKRTLSAVKHSDPMTASGSLRLTLSAAERTCGGARGSAE